MDKMNRKEKILDAIDTVCINCVEDTLNSSDICDDCPVRKLFNALNKNDDTVNQPRKRKMYWRL